VKDDRRVKSRGEAFVDRPVTRIWQEIPSKTNPYSADKALCHGYPLADLIEKRSFVDVLYLLLSGELPNSDQRDLLTRLMVGLCNPGPRHPAVRAAMTASVSKTILPNILPLGLAVMGSGHLGAGEVEQSMRFLRRHKRRQPESVVDLVMSRDRGSEVDDLRNIAPGFGQLYGHPDGVTLDVAGAICESPGIGIALNWSRDFVACLEPHGFSWLPTGLAAAAFLDLGFHPRAGAGLYQLITAPGILAHGLEMSNRPLTAMPFLSQENYIVE
jgi:citrate synthase